MSRQPLTLDDVIQRYAQQGHTRYAGEDVTQLQHGWQCARLASRAHASAELQLAAWLHDLGHLLTGWEGSPTLEGRDDRHEALGAAALEPLFGPAVARPVALHVQAKRYLVAARPNYARTLSPDSVRSLALQGGPMTVQEQQDFLADPFADDAVRLRVWDDTGKLGEWQPASTEEALTQLQALMQRVRAAREAAALAAP